MELKNIILEKEENLAIVTINRPKALNALNNQTITELGEVINEISKRKDIKTVIITGAGEKAFVAGADIVEMKDLNSMEARDFSRLAQKVFSDIENMPNCNSCC